MPKNRLVRALDLRKTSSPAPANLSGAAPVAGGGTTAHALSGPLHTGTLSASQAPWALTAAQLAAHAALPDVHHARAHSVLSGSDHTVSATAGQVLTAATSSTLGWSTPSYDVSAGGTALLRSEAGDLALRYLTATNLTATAQVRTPTVDTASGNLTLAPAAVLRLNPGTYTELIDAKPFRTASFTSGFAGAGLRIDLGVGQASKTTVEADNLWVRGRMHVYELLIHQIRATNGSIFVSSVGKVTGLTDNGGGSYSFVCEAGHGFAGGDIIRAQRWNAASSELYRTDMHVSFSPAPTSTTFTASLQGGTDAPALGHEFVRLGNLSDGDRQGGVYMTADDSGAPFIDVFDGVSSLAAWNTAGVVKVRVGNLNGAGDYSADVYGLMAGNSAGTWISADPNYGFRIMRGALARLLLTTDGDLVIRNGAGGDVIRLNNTGDGYFAGVMTLGTSGGIWQGSGTFASPTTGLKIWNASSVGRIAGYNGGTLQWGADTDGKLKFGGGMGVLDAGGIRLTRGIDLTRWNEYSTLKFVDPVSGAFRGGLEFREAADIDEWFMGFENMTGVQGLQDSVWHSSIMQAGDVARVRVNERVDGTASDIELRAFTVDLTHTAPTLNVGSANMSTGAASVQVGHARTGSGFATIDLVGDTTNSDYALRIIRGNGGANATGQILHRGTGNFAIQATEAAALLFQTAATTRMTIESTGNVDVVNELRAYVLRLDSSGAQSGVAGTITFGNEAYTGSFGTNTGTVRMVSGATRDNGCFVKMYVGTQVVWIPGWYSIT